MKQTDLFEEIIVDNFAGGGGASTGIELAAGRPVTIAINHDPSAILLHRTNHPYTEHLQASVWDVDPVQVCRGRKVGLAWFSPDCKHFSKAKGAALVDRNIRGLAWIVLRWAGTVRPRVILLENVEEFQTWGPIRKGKPIKKKAGQTFVQWKRQLEDLGYKIEHRELVAADYGAPTTRKRFVLVARCDGKPIVWPKPTHGPRNSPEIRAGKLLPWRSAAEIIDWSLPCPSIFESKAEILEKYGLKAAAGRQYHAADHPWSGQVHHHQITIEATCAPYKRKLTESSISAELSTELVGISCAIGQMPLVPLITVAQETVVQYGEYSTTIQAGAHLLPDLLMSGTQTIKAKVTDGTGTISITWREGSL